MYTRHLYSATSTTVRNNDIYTTHHFVSPDYKWYKVNTYFYDLQTTFYSDDFDLQTFTKSNTRTCTWECVCVQLSLPGLCASGSQLIACIARYPSCRRIWSHCQLYWTVVAQGLTWLRSWQRYDDRHGSGINHRARACSECGSAANVSRSYVTKWGLFEYMVMQMVMTSGRHAANGLRVRSGK